MNQSDTINEKIKTAFDIAANNCGGQLRMFAAINNTSSWVYTCIKRGVVPLVTAKKLEILTRGEVTWQEICPNLDKEIQDVSKYLEQ